MMKSLLLATCAICILASAAEALQISPSPPATTPKIIAADHHVHMVSPTSAVSAIPPLLPGVEVPKDIASLLDQRVANATNETAMKQIFVDWPMVLHALYPIWLRGEEALYTATGVPKGMRVVPQYYKGNGNIAVVAGIWMRGEGASAKPVTNFYLHAIKGEDGKWRIAAEALTAKAPPSPKVVDAEKLISELDAGGVSQGVALSLAYQIGSHNGEPELADEYGAVQKENDWNAAQAARYPDRLVPICGINPLKSYALREIARCAKIPGVRGIKLHFGSSAVDLRNAKHVETLKEIFRAASVGRLAIIVHIMTDRPDYGAADAKIFLDHLVPAAEGTIIQIAHLAGAGPGLDADPALEVFAKAAEMNDPRLKDVFFDLASNVTAETPASDLGLVAKRLRQLGLQRILFGSDRYSANEAPKAAFASLRRIPLTDAEMEILARNRAPYLQ